MTEEEKELEHAITKARYEYFKKNRKNFSKEADNLLSKIGEGYIPTEADVFELMTNDQSKINKYKEFYKIKDSISKDGRINQEDLDFLIKQLELDEKTSEFMKQLFKLKDKVK